MSGPQTIHASAVLMGTNGVLIRGASGSGKSALLLALIALDPVLNVLAADDRVALAAHHGRLVAGAPESLAGLIEVRGQGILTRPYVSPVVIDLVVDLLPLAECPRMPEPDERAEIAGLSLPRLALPAGTGDGPLRILTALQERVRRKS
jgi:serine kinase of HPr protein (carbohydrate metabolism regulator)